MCSLERIILCLGLVGRGIMNLISPLQIWLFLLLVIPVLLIRVERDRQLNLTTLSPLQSQSNLIDRPNQTSLASGISAKTPAIICDGDQYGRELDFADCKDAVTGIKRSRQELRYGERSADQRTWDVGLPFRQIGSEDAAEETPLQTLFGHLTLQ